MSKKLYLCGMDIQPIAYFESPLKSKFGIPRQSGLAGSLTGRIVFVQEYRQMEAVRGMEDFDYLWLIWEFSANGSGKWKEDIYDIKPYVAYADSHPHARSGFVDNTAWQPLGVDIPEAVERCFTPEELEALRQLLALDPRPQYHDDPERVYGFPFGKFDIRFRVADGTLHVVEAVSSSL